MKIINSEILELSKQNKIIYNALMMHERGDMTYTEMLEQLVLTLTDANHTLLNELIHQVQVMGSEKEKHNL